MTMWLYNMLQECMISLQKSLDLASMYGTNIELVHVLYLLLGIDMILNDWQCRQTCPRIWKQGDWCCSPVLGVGKTQKGPNMMIPQCVIKHAWEIHGNPQCGDLNMIMGIFQLEFAAAHQCGGCSSVGVFSIGEPRSPKYWWHTDFTAHLVLAAWIQSMI